MHNRLLGVLSAFFMILGEAFCYVTVKTGDWYPVTWHPGRGLGIFFIVYGFIWFVWWFLDNTTQSKEKV